MADQPGHLYIQDVIGTRYPYLNLTESSIGQKLNDFRRSISAVNPFALPQVPSQDRIAFGIRKGNTWYKTIPYPNGVKWGKMFPAHYDPLHDEFKMDRWQLEQSPPGWHSHYVFTADKLPRACVRTLQSLRKCEMINGVSECPRQEKEILEICPTWTLDDLKEKQRFMLKVAAINAQQYRTAMEVSPYNQGRTIKDISDRTWVDGTRTHLRPDTLWADERYSKITQSEINEAKKRVEERKQKHAGEHTEKHHAESGHDYHYDHKHIALKQPKPLYP